MTLRSFPRLFAAAVLVAALALAGCSASAARTTGTSDGAGVVGVTLPSTDDLAWVRAGDAVSAELRGRGYRVDLQFAAADARTQAAHAQNMITKGEDAVVLVPVSLDALSGARDAAAIDGIPVVAVARDLDGAGAVAAVDPAAVAQAQVEALIDDVRTAPGGSPATVAVLAGDSADPDAAARHAAALDALAPAVADGTVTVSAGADFADAAVADAPGDVESAAEDRARELVGADDRPAAVLALGDAVTRGVVTALTTPDPDASPSPVPTPTPSPEDPDPAPVVVGSGGDTATVRALRDGVLDATVFVDTRLLAAAVADAVEAVLAGTTPEDGAPLEAAVVRGPGVRSVFLDSGWLEADDL